MGMLPARHYVSEHTKFITEVLAQKPQLVDEQKKGRAMWWDKSPREADRLETLERMLEKTESERAMAAVANRAT